MLTGDIARVWLLTYAVRTKNTLMFEIASRGKFVGC